MPSLFLCFHHARWVANTGFPKRNPVLLVVIAILVVINVVYVINDVINVVYDVA